MEESPPPSPSSSSGDFNADGFGDDGPVMYDPSVVYDDDLDTNLLDDDDDDDADHNNSNDSNEDEGNDMTEEDENDYYTRGRSRSRSVHCNDDLEDGKQRGLSDEELSAQIEQAAKNHEKDINKPVVVRTGALKHREVQALKMGLQEATPPTKEEERLEEQAEKEAALREKEERSVSISNSSPSGRGGGLHTATPLGLDPPMRRVKILLLGDSSVGKSSLIHRITDNTFKQSLVSTVGVDYKVRKLQINGENVQVQLWDTAGSEKFHKITQSYYRGVHGIMLVFDVSNRKSFKHVSYWLSNISKHANEHVQVQLVGNKVDLRPEDKKDPQGNASKINSFMRRKSKAGKVSEEAEGEVEKDPFVQAYEGLAVASKFQIKYAETSALNNTNIEESLAQCVKQVIQQLDNPSLMDSLRDKLQKKDSKSRLSSSDSSRGRLSSGEKKAQGTLAERQEEKADPATSNKAKDSSSKDKDCAIS